MAIPKIIHYCWLGGNEKPDSVKRCIASWRKYCPDYEIREWNESNLNLDANAYTRQAYDAKAWGFVPDYLRLWIVYTHGGIYLDTDVQVIRSFDSLLEEKAFVGFEDDIHISLGLGFGAEAGHGMLQKLMEAYENLRFLREDGEFNRTPSPEYSTSIFRANGAKENNGTIQTVEGVKIYPPEYFCPKSFTTGITKLTKNTYSIHQFDASWYSEEEQEQKEKWQKAARQDYWAHTPQRVARKIFGDAAIDRVKKILKG